MQEPEGLRPVLDSTFYPSSQSAAAEVRQGALVPGSPKVFGVSWARGIQPGTTRAGKKRSWTSLMDLDRLKEAPELLEIPLFTDTLTWCRLIAQSGIRIVLDYYRSVAQLVERLDKPDKDQLPFQLARASLSPVSYRKVESIGALLWIDLFFRASKAEAWAPLLEICELAGVFAHRYRMEFDLDRNITQYRCVALARLGRRDEALDLLQRIIQLKKASWRSEEEVGPWREFAEGVV